MAIKVNIRPTEENLTGKSHWWGFPDLPKGVVWPYRCSGDTTPDEEELLTFICQIRLEDIAPIDTEGQLPHKGMLWFFADIDYFLGEMDAPCAGIGEWERGRYRVLYAEDCRGLVTHEYYWEDGTPAVIPAEELVFETVESSSDGFKLLGEPYMTEGYENENEGLVSLLQLDEEERWHLRFFDCGTINFMITEDGLRRRDFSAAMLFLHSS